MKKHSLSRKFIFPVFYAAILILGSAEIALCERFLSARKTTPWIFVPAIGGGINKLLEGYDGYNDNESLTLDVYVQAPRRHIFPTEWQDNFLFRMSLDYFPFEVPDGVFGIEEEMVALNAGLVYRIHSLERVTEAAWIPFVGAAAGLYQDRVTLDTPATGKIKGNHNNFGYNFSAGLFFPKIKIFVPIRLVPEVRYHIVQIPGGQSTNITYQASISFWPFDPEN